MSTKRAREYGSTPAEIGEYWDDHDLGEIWDETEPVEIAVDLRSERHYYSIERSLSERVHQIAEARGVSSETLVNLWLQEKVGQSG